MVRQSSFRTAVLALLMAALTLTGQAPLQAQTVTNTARASWNQAGRSFSETSNTVAFEVVAKPITIDTFVNTPGGNQSLAFSPSMCGGSMITPGAGQTATVLTASAIAASTLHIGDTFYFRVVADQANRNPAAIDSITTVLTTHGSSASGDRETIEVFETGANTGVFIGAVPTSAIPPQPVQGDCRLSVAANATIGIAVLNSGSPASGNVSPIATAALDVLADPFGFVFDSEDGSPVDGAQVTLVNAATGAPAQVFAPDGVTPWPATLTSGSQVTDAAGRTYQLTAGEYRFPLAAPGQYRVVVTPPAPYVAPSAATPAQLAGLVHPDGSPVVIDEGSFGRPFTLTSFAAVRLDVPVDRPAVAVSLSKTASRDRVQPGDAVFYTVIAQNVDSTRAKRGVVLVDQPSASLRLRPSSIRVDGAARPDAVTVAADGRTLTVALGNLAPGAKRTVTYAMTVRPDAAAGQALNKATATDARGTAAFASAVVSIEPDSLTGRMTLIGRVTAGGCSATGPRPGIPGVRVMLEDGSFAVTDADGRYHFDGLVPGNHVAAVAPQTLPEGAQFVNCGRSTRNAGSATSRFVSGQGGSLAVGDFYADVPVAVLENLVSLSRKKQEQAAQNNTVIAKPGEGGEAPAAPAAENEADRSDRAAAGGDTDWLALGDGPPAFLFPGPDHNPRAPAVRVAIRHKPDQTIDLTADGKPVAKVSFDGLKKSANNAWAVSLWRGIPIENEVVHLAAVVRNRDGSVATRLTRDVHFTGIAADVRLLPERSKLVADGRTRPVIAVRLLDRAGRPVHAGISGEFQLGAPYESAEALDAMQSRALTGLGRNAPHWTVKGDDGIALIELAPTLVSGSLQLDFTFTDGQQKRRQTLNTWIVPGDQKWTLVGLAEGSVGAKTVADAMERTGQFDSDLGQRARAAFYAKGRVRGSTLLTVAYDSGKQRNDQRLLGAIDPRAYYTVFADGSDRRFDAASRNRLYVRIESRSFTALFGDFATNFNQTLLTRYQRVATGVQAEGRLGGLHAQGFATRVASGHLRDEIQGGGITGPYALSSRAIIANSETVVIQTRDRFRSEVIVDSRSLTRFVDYDVDLLSGTITFKAPVLSRDSAQNPQFIVVDYEVDQTAAGGQLNAGGRVDVTTANGAVRVGATAISDTGNGPRTGMGGLDLKARIRPGTEVRAEIAGSRRSGATSTAWLAEIEHHDGRLDVIAYARSMEQGYGVGQVNGVESGRRKFGVDTRYSVTERLSLIASGWLDDSLTDATHREAAQAQAQYRSGRNTFRGGFTALRDHLADGSVATSTVLDAGVTQRLFNERLELDASTSIGLGQTQSVDLPSRHQLALRYAVNSSVRLVGSYEIAKGGAVNARTGRVGFELTPWRGSRITSSLGQQDIAELGKRSFAAFGLAQSFDVSRRFTLDASLDSNKVISGIAANRLVNPRQPATSGGFVGTPGAIAEDFTAITLGGTYRARRWTITTRGEWRDGEFANRKGVTFGAIRQLGEGSVFGSGVTYTRANGIDSASSQIFDGAIALAHRPANSALATLAKLEFRSDRIVGGVQGVAGPTGPTALDVTGSARSSRLIGSVSFNLSPRGRDGDRFVQRSEIGLFSAVRYSFDRYQDTGFAATALLGGIDAHIGIGERVEVGGTATVRTALTDRVTSFAFGPSIGVVPARDVILTLGYNVTGFRDRDFTAARNTTRGVFATLRAKFDTSTLGFLGLGR